MNMSREQLIKEISEMARKSKEQRATFIAELKKIFPELNDKNQELKEKKSNL